MKKILLAIFISLFAVQVQAATRDLIYSAKTGNISAITTLLVGGENINGTDESGSTALHYAVAADNKELVILLMAFGADATIANKEGLTPIDIADQNDLENVTSEIMIRNQLPQKSDNESAK